MEQPQVELDWLILADAAEIVGGKLYLLGGGWDQLNVAGDFPAAHACQIAAAFAVPWNLTNRRHPVSITFAHDDGAEIARINTEVEVGRPAGFPPGMTQRAQLAIALTLTFPRPGGYVAIVRIEETEKRRVPFVVNHIPRVQTTTIPPQP